jgi:16S rRNA (cytosine1402-N4)-methyltransferase
MMSKQTDHKPVLLKQVLDGLNIRRNGIYVDCTYGRGGHSAAILEQLDDDGRLFVFDRDPLALRHAELLFGDDPRVVAIHGAFSRLTEKLRGYQVIGAVDGLLFDLGVSSPQLDDGNYGFSFLRDGDLDMRMDPGAGISAMDWINHADLEDIEEILRTYGEERYARRIARAVVEARAHEPVTRTRQLAGIIAATVPTREKTKDPATRSFLAVRIFINNEIGELEAVLKQVNEVLKPGGRLVIISFHSLEDRIVKRFMRNEARGNRYPQDIPVTEDQMTPTLKLVGKAIKPSAEEIKQNPRARSAVLRVGEKIAA